MIILEITLVLLLSFWIVLIVWTIRSFIHHARPDWKVSLLWEMSQRKR